MEVLIKITQLLLSLSILIVLHEFGHFLFARVFNTRVEKFYLFFNPWFELFKFKKGDTEYGMGWLPLGGYVKISGMIDESMDKEQMAQPPQPWEFRSKPAWQRLLIMLGGVMVNFVLGIAIYSMVLFTWGEEYLANKDAIYGIACEELATEMGLKDGDKIIMLDQKPVEKFSEIVPALVLDEVMTIKVLRADDTLTLAVPDDLVKRLVKSESFISPRFPFTIGGFASESAGKDAGMLMGDRIFSINGDTVPYFNEFRAKLQNLKNQSILVGVIRNDSLVSIPVTIPETGLLGIAPGMEGIFNVSRQEFGFFESFPAGIGKGYQTAANYLKQLRLLFSPETKAYESIGGFITIGNIFPGVWDWQAFWGLTAFLSIMLAILNVLPIPALDGGHVLFLLYELITRRKPSDKFMEYAQITGMFLLLALLLWANGNDVIRLFN